MLFLLGWPLLWRWFYGGANAMPSDRKVAWKTTGWTDARVVPASAVMWILRRSVEVGTAPRVKALFSR